MLATRPPRNKYGAIKTKIGDLTFDSKAEARRYSELKLLEKAGEITNLLWHPSYVFCLPNGIHVKSKAGRILKYIADFSYLDRKNQRHIEDVKGHQTEASKLKIALTEALYGITVEIVR